MQYNECTKADHVNPFQVSSWMDRLKTTDRVEFVLEQGGYRLMQPRTEGQAHLFSHFKTPIKLFPNVAVNHQTQKTSRQIK